jgi:hypothetical protein
MRRVLLAAGMLCIGAVVGWGQATEKKPDPPPKAVFALSWLVGGVWTADASKMGSGMQRIETRYRWSDNNAYIHFTTHFVFVKGTANTYDGQFFWNPAQKSLAMWYMDAQNGISEGPEDQVQFPRAGLRRQSCRSASLRYAKDERQLSLVRAGEAK